MQIKSRTNKEENREGDRGERKNESACLKWPTNPFKVKKARYL